MVGEVAADRLEAVVLRMFVLHVLSGDLETGFVRLRPELTK